MAAVLLIMDLPLLLLAWLKQGADREMALLYMAICTLAAGILLILHVLLSRLSSRDRKRRRHRKGERRQGAALVLVLVLTALMAAVVLQVQVRARAALARAAAGALHTRLELTATDAARRAFARLADDSDLGVDHLDEAWAALEDYRDPAGARCTVQVRDEQGFFNLNNLAAPGLAEGQRPPEAVLVDLFAACGVSRPVQRTLALRDWIDEDRVGDGEQSAHAQEEGGQRPPNRPLANWREVLEVNGMDRALFEPRPRGPLEDALRGDLVDAVTVLPAGAARVTPVNVNTAGRDALRGILGLEYSGRVERLLKERASRPLRSLDALGLPPDVLDAARPYLGVSSSYFSVTATAEQDDDAAEVRALAMRDDKGTVRLLHWVTR
jgi:type II secretory pathway component PulK